MSDFPHEDSLTGPLLDEVFGNAELVNDGFLTAGQLKQAGIRSPEDVAKKFGDGVTYEWAPAIAEENRRRAETVAELNNEIRHDRMTPEVANLIWHERHGTPESLSEAKREFQERMLNRREVTDTKAVQAAHEAFLRTVREAELNDPEYQKLSNILATLQAMREEF